MNLAAATTSLRAARCRWPDRAGRRNVTAMTVQAVAEKPDGQGGVYVLFFHHDRHAELQHRAPGPATRTVIGKHIVWRVRAEMVAMSITEDGWTPA